MTVLTKEVEEAVLETTAAVFVLSNNCWHFGSVLQRPTDKLATMPASDLEVSLQAQSSWLPLTGKLSLSDKLSFSWDFVAIGFLFVHF